MSENSRWTVEDMPDLTGKFAVVTGGNSGIGYETVKALARKGAEVVIASRSVERGNAAAAAIRREHPDASLQVMELDLADLASVRRFAATFTHSYSHLHILCNNAGVMAIPYRQTADGFEMQFGTNHLGHFALTGLLLECIIRTPRARVVTVSSGAHQMGRINVERLNNEEGYNAWRAYGQSKLANLLFAYELQRIFEAEGVDAISVAAHPGYAATNLQAVGPQMAGSVLWEKVMEWMNRLVSQSAEMGALPTLYAATAADVNGCDYIGPDGLFGMRGYPEKVHSNDLSYDPVVARRLWEVSEEMTGVHYIELAAA